MKANAFLSACLIILATMMSACSDSYDDSKLKESVDDLENRVKTLETLCKEMNSNITSLQTLVNALQDNDYIKNVSPVLLDGKTIGYTIQFLKANPITIYHGTNGTDGKDGENGIDGVSPVVGVKKDSDGIYYWTLNDEWLLDGQNNKIKVQGSDGKDGEDGDDGKNGEDGITPHLKIENGYWFISYDNQTTWTKVSPAFNSTVDSYFKDITEDKDFVNITLTSGTVLHLSKYKPVSITFSESGNIRVIANTIYKINYTLTGADSTTSVKAIAQDGYRAVVKPKDHNSGMIEITTPENISDSEILIFVSDGKDQILISSISFIEGTLNIATKTYTVAYDGEQIDVNLTTNIEYDIEIPWQAQSWISITPASKAAKREETLSFTIQPNSTGKARSATISFSDKWGIISETILINQRGGTTQTVNITTGGTLEQTIGNDSQTIEELKITGTLNAVDYEFLKTMSRLKKVDLSELSDVTMPEKAFYISEVSTVLLPQGLIAIPDEAFYGSKITSIEIPKTVQRIGQSAFASTNQMKGDIVIPDATVFIGAQAFSDCSFDGTLTLGKGLKEIGSSAFLFCKKCKGDLIIPDNVETLDGAFSLVQFTGKLIIGKGVKTINGFNSSKFSGNLIIPDNVETIGSKAFLGASFTGSLKIGNGVEIIGQESFANTKFNGSIILGQRLTTINKGAFSNCAGLLGNLVIPDNVKTIGDEAFYRCTSLTGTLTLGENLKTIGQKSFIDGTNSKLNFSKIYCKAPTPPTISENTFYSLGDKPSYLGVPTGTSSTYKESSFWKDFIVIEDVNF